MNIAVLDTRKPMGAARYVRREKYAWPGGYAVALITTDGGTLCPDCVESEFHQISSANRRAVDDGWRPAGMLCEAETDDGCDCDHCGREVWPGFDDDRSDC